MLAIALENAIEGCCERDTRPALIARHQAHAARDPHVHAAFEQMSAALAPRLSADAMRVVGLPDEATGSALLAQLGAALSLSASDRCFRRVRL